MTALEQRVAEGREHFGDEVERRAQVSRATGVEILPVELLDRSFRHLPHRAGGEGDHLDCHLREGVVPVVAPAECKRTSTAPRMPWRWPLRALGLVA